MPYASYQRILQSCRHAFTNSGDPVAELPVIEGNQINDLIEGACSLQEWTKHTANWTEFQAHYWIGEAMNVNQQRRQQRKPTENLKVSSREKTNAVRIYLLFRDHFTALPHIRGIGVHDIRKLSQKDFDELLHTLEGEYPPFIDFGEPTIWLDGEYEEEELDEFDI